MPKVTYLPAAGAKNYDVKKSLPKAKVDELQRNMREWQAQNQRATVSEAA